jgi:hypothetical protein
MNSLTDVLKSPSVWTGKDGVTAVTDLLKNPPLQDKIQFGLMKSSFDTLVKTGEIVTPGTDLKKPAGQLYDAAANAGKNLISASAGLVAAPKALSSLAGDTLSNLSGSLSGALGSVTGLAGAATGALGSATSAISGATGAISGITSAASGALGSITSGLPSVSGLANRGSAELGGLLATASKFGVGNAVAWAKGATSATDAISGATGSLASGVTGAISGAASRLTSGLKTQMDSLAKQGQFAVNFSDFKLPAAVAGIIPAAGFKGTIDRSTLNAATSKLIGSDKIPLPNFSPQSVDTSALTDAANKAKGLLSGGLDASGLLSTAKGALGGLTAGATSVLGKTVFSGTDPTTLLRLGQSPDPLAAIKSKIRIG